MKIRPEEVMLFYAYRRTDEGRTYMTRTERVYVCRIVPTKVRTVTLNNIN
jgi:hypothetical protein